jgi:CRP-like cAMP-binding protein
MLAVEQEPIRLVEIRSEVLTPQGWSVETARGRRVLVPTLYSQHWESVRRGSSLYELSLNSRAPQASASSSSIGGDQGPRTFLDVAGFLCFLADQDLIEEIRLLSLADALRGEFTWPELITSLRIWDSPLGVWGRRGLRGPRWPLWAARAIDALAAILGLLGVLIGFVIGGAWMILGWKFMSQPAGGLEAGWRQLAGLALGLWVFVPVMRSLLHALRAAASYVNGDAGRLSWVLELSGLRVAFQPETISGGARRAFDYISHFGLGTGVLLVGLGVQALGDEMGLLAAMWGVLTGLVIATHAASMSDVVQSLKVWNRVPIDWRESEELDEIESFHALSVLLTLSGVALVFAGGLQWSLLAWKSGARLEAFAALGIAGILALMLAEPWWAKWLPGRAQRNQRRRLWASRLRGFDVLGEDRQAWRDLPMLRQLTAQVRDQLVAKARVIQLHAGKAACHQGAADRSLFVVLSGRLAVVKAFEGRRRKVVAFLDAGAAFGETAFFFATPRTADVVAMETSRLLEIPYLPGMQSLDISQSEEFRFRVWFLQALSSSSWLSELPAEAMDTLVFAGQRRGFRAGETVFTEGAPGDAMYFIVQGRVSVTQGGRKINEMGTGEAFGEIALMTAGQRRTATVVADSELLVMELSRDEFWKLLAARLPLGFEVERLARRRLRADVARR